MDLTRLAVQRKLATSAIIIALVVLGAFGLWRLPVNYLPDISYPLIKVRIQWPAASPEEIDAEIAAPLERVMATVDDLEGLESTLVEGLYSLDVHFNYGTDTDIAFQDVLAALTRAQRRLPTDIEPPYVFKADPSQLPVLRLAVSTSRWGPVLLRDWTENWLQDRVLAVDGVAGTEIIGGLKREIRVLLDPEALAQYDLSLAEVLDQIKRANSALGSGRVLQGAQELIVRSLNEFSSLEELRGLELTGSKGQKVLLEAIADVVDGHEQPRMQTRFNGQDCVTVSVLKQAEANSVESSKNIKSLLSELRPSLPAGVEIQPMQDQAEYIEQALSGLRDTLVLAAILLISVVYLFLGSWRQVLVLVFGLPLCLLISFWPMDLAGFSLNIFTLGGLVIALGLVLDNSIVVLENITRLRRAAPGQRLDRQAVAGTEEVAPALIAASLSFLALFTPFLIIPGLTSLLFRELILVVAVIVALSLVLSLSLTPVLMSAWSKGVRPKVRPTKFEVLFERFKANYARGLGLALARPWAVVAVFALGLSLSGVLFFYLGGEFLPVVDDGRVLVKVKMPPGSSLARTAEVVGRIEAKISDDPLVLNSYALAGGYSKGLASYELANEGEVDIQLVPQGERRLSSQAYVRNLRRRLKQVQPVQGKVMVKKRPLRGVQGGKGASDLLVQVRGQETAVLKGLATQVIRSLNQLGEIGNVSMATGRSRPEYWVRLDRTRAAEFGVTAAALSATLRTLIIGAVPTHFNAGAESYAIRVLVPERKLISHQDLEDLVLGNFQGRLLRLGDVARVDRVSAPVEIRRQDQIKQIAVEADVKEGNLSGALRAVRSELAKIKWPLGYGLAIGGKSELMAESRESLLGVLALALFLAFVVLTVQFNDLKTPALILGSVPFCLPGIVLGLYLTGCPLSATVVIGALIVVAIMVNDGVLLLGYAHRLQDLSSHQAVLEAAKVRLRPRLMTTITTMAGLLPLALNLRPGGDMLQPMAIAAFGGLGLEVLVALFLMPCLYCLIYR